MSFIKAKLNDWYWRMYVNDLALASMFQIQLGDKVWYEDKLYIAMNGVSADYWHIQPVGGEYVDRVHAPRDQCIKQKSIKNYYNSYKFMKRFYTLNWLGIWKHSGIEPWMLSCKIWPKGWWD